LISGRASAILRRLVHRTTALSALAALALASAGCATPCEDLGKRICACQSQTTATRDACDRAVRAALLSANPTACDFDKCDLFLRTCPDPSADGTACDQQKTDAGKMACGLAYCDPAVTSCPPLPATCN
jgi:hypothetical protein